ncbi:unnamed protein product [Gadus morhua 'NCC']
MCVCVCMCVCVTCVVCVYLHDAGDSLYKSLSSPVLFLRLMLKNRPSASVPLSLSLSLSLLSLSLSLSLHHIFSVTLAFTHLPLFKPARSPLSQRWRLLISKTDMHGAREQRNK